MAGNEGRCANLAVADLRFLARRGANSQSRAGAAVHWRLHRPPRTAGLRGTRASVRNRLAMVRESSRLCSGRAADQRLEVVEVQAGGEGFACPG